MTNHEQATSEARFPTTELPLGSLDVIIVTHQSADHVVEAIGKLPTMANVIVVDNGSTDGTPELARRAGAHVVVNDVNAGFAAGANQGAELGHGDLIVFLNPDASIGGEDVRKVVRFLEEQPERGVVSPRVVYADGTEQRVRWPYPSAKRAWLEAFGLHRLAPTAAHGGFVIGACLLVRRSVFEQLGGFDARYWLYAEETDFCHRAREAGWSVSIVDGAVAQHVGGASGEDAPRLVREHFERGTERFIFDREGVFGLVSYRVASLVGGLIRTAIPGSPRRRALHGARLRRFARALVARPFSVPLESPATTALGRGLVVCSLEAWDEVWRRNQFLVRDLLKEDPHLRVLFVEPAFDWVHERRRKSGRKRRRGLRTVDHFNRVVRFEPGKLLPRILGPFADRSLRRQVRSAVAQLGFDVPTLWVNDPSHAALVRETGWPALYDITDDWVEAAATTRARRRIRRYEAELLEHSHAVVVCSPGLAASRRTLRPDLVIIPNAVDAEHFRRAQARPQDLPQSPVAVYVGTLHEDRLDVELVARLPEQIDGLHVALVGPNCLSPETNQRLARAPRLHLLGAKAYEVVPAYLQHADVVVVPHVVTPFTESLDPIKAYECAAVGRPTVATPVAGFRELEPAVQCADGDHFSGAVRDALQRPSLPSFAAPPSWEARAARFRGVLEDLRNRACPKEFPSTEALPMQVLRVWHAGVIDAWRERERWLHRAGVEVHLIAAHAWNEGGALMPFEADPDGLASKARVWGTHPFIFAYDPRELYRRLREGDVSLVDLEEEPASLAVFEFLVLRTLARSHVPFCLYSAQNIEKRYPPPFRWFERAALKHAAAVRVCNGEAGRIMRKKGFVGRIELIGLGVDTDRMSKEPRRPHSNFRVGYVGRLEEHKGVHVLVDAIARVHDATLTIIGDGPSRAALERRVHAHGMEGRTTFTGFVAHGDLPREYATLDVLVVPSLPRANWVEQFGRVAVEAMAAGVPVIASDCGELPALVGDAGQIVPPDDHRALAETIAALARDQELRDTLATRGRARAAHYSWQALGAAHYALYRAIVDAAAAQ